LMPQFDIFSFFSQLFWVFLGFFTLYLLMCFCILPALATILKVRSNKLKQISNLSTSNSLETTNQNKIDISGLLGAWSTLSTSKLSSNTNFSNSSVIIANINSFIVKFDVVREYNSKTLSQLLLISFFK